VFPIPDRRFSNADDFCDFSLEETEVHSSFADVVTDGHGINGITGERLFFEGNFD
jgi:hypothetical protein